MTYCGFWGCTSQLMMAFVVGAVVGGAVTIFMGHPKGAAMVAERRERVRRWLRGESPAEAAAGYRRIRSRGGM